MTRSTGNGRSSLTYGLGMTQIGRVLIVRSERGVCGLRLVERESEAQALAAIRRDLPDAELTRDDSAVADILEHVHALLNGTKARGTLRFDAKGTPFQQAVWRAMRKVPPGTTCSYQELARRAGKPRAVRAAAHACARNPIAILVPCHRIISSDGSLGGYFYGLDVKRHLLELEGCQSA